MLLPDNYAIFHTCFVDWNDPKIRLFIALLLLQSIMLGGYGQFFKLCELDHPYPATKVMFAPCTNAMRMH
jgi:hypothetical protein